jgi:hypothetical protein
MKPRDHLGDTYSHKRNDNEVNLEDWRLMMFNGFTWLRAGCSSGLVKQKNELSASIESGEFLDRLTDC